MSNVPSLEETFATLQYTVDQCIVICESKEFTDEVMAHAGGQFPDLTPTEIKAALVPQAVALLPGLKAAAAAALAEKTKQEEAVQEHLQVRASLGLAETSIPQTPNRWVGLEC